MNKSYEKLYLTVYSGVHHAFFNDSRKQMYNENASKSAWNILLTFFKENLSN
ncbi:MAG: dienelactone hydrolase family protein [Candidatus Micrarchaeia archaeon]